MLRIKNLCLRNKNKNLNIPVDRETVVYFKGNKVRVWPNAIIFFATKNFTDLFLRENLSKSFSKYMSARFNRKIVIELKLCLLQCHKYLTLGKNTSLVDALRKLAKIGNGVHNFSIRQESVYEVQFIQDIDKDYLDNKPFTGVELKTNGGAVSIRVQNTKTRFYPVTVIVVKDFGKNSWDVLDTLSKDF